VIHILTANCGQFKHCNRLKFISFFDGRMFSRRMVTNITSARGTEHCRKTRIPCGDQFLTCGLYEAGSHTLVIRKYYSVTFYDCYRSLPPVSQSRASYITRRLRELGGPIEKLINPREDEQSDSYFYFPFLDLHTQDVRLTPPLPQLTRLHFTAPPGSPFKRRK
jgi:hypothetical protein